MNEKLRRGNLGTNFLLFRIRMKSNWSTVSFDGTRVTHLSWQPRAFIYKGFMLDEECDHLINLFQALRAMVQANPQILQPMLQELGKQNPQLVRLIQEHQGDFLRLLNEPTEGGEAEGNILGQLGAAMPQAVQVTPEEREALGRLEALGFDRALVLEVFFVCNRNEELAANYLLDHMHEFED